MPSMAFTARATTGAALAILLLASAALSGGRGGAQPPSATVDTTAAEPSGRTIAVPSGGDLQAALESARTGDSVVLEPGATYRGRSRCPGRADPAGS